MLEEIRALQEERMFLLGYRQMAMQLSRRLGKPVSKKRAALLMREGGLLSRVSRKRYSEEACAARRAAKAMKAPDLVGRRFFSSRPRRVCA